MYIAQTLGCCSCCWCRKPVLSLEVEVLHPVSACFIDIADADEAAKGLRYVLLWLHGYMGTMQEESSG